MTGLIAAVLFFGGLFSLVYFNTPPLWKKKPMPEPKPVAARVLFGRRYLIEQRLGEAQEWWVYDISTMLDDGCGFGFYYKEDAMILFERLEAKPDSFIR